MNMNFVGLRKLIIILISVLFSLIGSSQVIIPGDYAREYYDLLLFQDTSLNKPINQFPSIIKQYHKDGSPSWNVWGENFNLDFSKAGEKSSFYLVDPILRYNYNSLTPRSYNDGAQWNGKGSNLFLSGGVAGHIGILHYAFVPNIQVSQNRNFEIPDTPTERSEFAYPFDSRIDWVQRFGDGTYTNFDLGQSEVRLIYKNATLGVSTENFRWGVTQFSPLLMSYNAPGFPHLDVGTNVPVTTKIGRIEGRAFWGLLKESDYFDNDSNNETGYITGFHLGYQPSFFPELSLGLNRVMNTRWSDGELQTRDFFAMFLLNSHNDDEKNDEYDQMMSVYLDLSFPEAGFRTYVEFARNDFPGNIKEFFELPDRSRAYTIGMMKTFEFKNDDLIRLLFEYTTLSRNQVTRFITPNPTYYVHPWSVRGYTNRGQIMGAGIGPGSNSNFIKLDWYKPKGKWGITFTRIRFNDDYSTNVFAGTPDFPTDFEVALGVDYVRFIDKLTINPNFTWSDRSNWYFDDDREVSNFFMGVNLSYRFR